MSSPIEQKRLLGFANMWNEVNPLNCLEMEPIGGDLVPYSSKAALSKNRSRFNV